MLSVSVDAVWWTPGGRTSVSQPQVISDITDGDAGLYVCVSGDHGVVSVFNLQISKRQGPRRNTRSLSRSDQRITPPRSDTKPDSSQEQSRLTLAVCLSVVITFLIAFILGVLARPFIDALWKRVTTKKRPPATNGAPAEQRQYDNEAFSSGEEPGQIAAHRERRVTFSTVDFTDEINVHYYDTVAGGSQKDTSQGPVAASGTRPTGSENASRRDVTEEQKEHGPAVVTSGGRTRDVQFEPIPDPDELEERSPSSSSDSSVSDKQTCARLETEQVQQRPQASVKGTSGPARFASEPFADWSPHANDKSRDSDLWQEKEEQFEFSDSVRSTPERPRRSRDTSSSSSCVSEGEPTEYTVNSDREEEGTKGRSHSGRPEQPSSSDSSDSDCKPIKSTGVRGERSRRAPSLSSTSSSGDSGDEATPGKVNVAGLPLQTRFPAVDLRHVPRVKRRLDVKAPSLGSESPPSSDRKVQLVLDQQPKPSPASTSSSSSDSEDEAPGHAEKPGTGKVVTAPSSTTRFPALDLEHVPQIERRLDIKAPSSSSESEDETRGHVEKQDPGAPSDPDKWWSVIDLQHIPHVKRRLDIKAPSPGSDSSSSEEEKIPVLAPSPDSSSSSSSDSEDEVTNLTVKPSPAEQETSEPNGGDAWRPAPQFDPRVKKRLDVKAPDSESSSSSDSDEEKQKSNTAELPAHARWPALDLHQLPPVQRRLDIKAPSPASSSDSEDEAAEHVKEPEQATSETSPGSSSSSDGGPLHHLDAQWPSLDLQRLPRIKRRLDITTLPPPAYSPPHSETKKHEQREVYESKPCETDVWPDVKAPSQASDLSTSSDSENETTETGMDLKTQWPVVGLGNNTGVKRRLDIKRLSPPQELMLSGGSQSHTTRPYYTSSSSDEEGDLSNPPIKVVPHPSWPEVDLSAATRVKRRLDVKAPSLGSGSSSDSEAASPKSGRETLDELRLGVPHVTRRLDVKARPASRLAPSSSSGSDSSSSEGEKTKGTEATRREPALKTGPGVRLDKYTVIADGSAANDSSGTTAEVNPELQSKWATMNLGISRFRKRLEITSRAPPPAPPGDGPHDEEAKDELVQTDSSSTTSSSTGGDETTHRGIRRYLDIKAPHRSDSSTSCSEDEDTRRGVDRMTDDESAIAYKRLIMKPPSLLSQPGAGNESVPPRRVQSLNVDDVVKRSSNRLGGTTDLDLPPQIRWPGVSRHLSALSASSPRQNLDVAAEPDTSPGRTRELLKTLSEEKREKKGLSALKVMSSERRRWDADLGPRDASFPRRRSGDDAELVKQLHVSSTSTDGKRAAHLLDGLSAGTEAPPPVPEAPPPDEAAEPPRGPPPSLRPHSLLHYFDSPLMNISDA